MTNKISNYNTQSFKGNSDWSYKIAKRYLNSEDKIAQNRFIQDTATNWLPKAIFTRGIADFADMSFLEFIESGIFYFAPTAIGNRLKKIYTNAHSEEAKTAILKNIGKSAESILASPELKKDDIGKKTLSTKAAIILACTAVPAAEYALSFAKNLFTLKTFKKSDFNNIANLNKNQSEDKQQQEHVEKSAIKHLKAAGLVSLAGLGASIIFAKYGHKSDLLQKASDIILQPGAYIANGLKKIGLIKGKNPEEGLEGFLKTYITPDFDGIEEGINEKTKKPWSKFILSKGQLLITTVSGFFGYSAAAKDRGKLDQYEVWTRVPFVVLYTVFGSVLFDKLFNKVLIDKKIFPDILKKDEKGNTIITKNIDLPKIAKKLAIKKNTSELAELERLTKQKAIAKGVPYFFGIVVMGFFLSGITRFWTQYRYDHDKDKKQAKKSEQLPELIKQHKNIIESFGMNYNKKNTK